MLAALAARIDSLACLKPSPAAVSPSFPVSWSCTMTEAQFAELAAQGYNHIPLVLETFADLDTPLSIYLKLANRPYSYLLESVHGGERFGRYSVIGLPAAIRIEVRGRHIKL